MFTDPEWTGNNPPPYQNRQEWNSWDIPKQKAGKYQIYYKYALPASFITYGILSKNFHPLKQVDRSIHSQVDDHVRNKFPIDDYLQFAPAVGVYGVSLLLPFKAKHSYRDRTFVMVTSHLIMGGTVQLMKKNIHTTRPDGVGTNSFPSGHTATAFTGAHILFREYRDESLWIGATGYAAAATTGLLRILNDRHWFSDVMAGAGIGILSVEISYLLLPVFRNLVGIKDNRNLMFAPVVQNGGLGMGMAYTF